MWVKMEAGCLGRVSRGDTGLMWFFSSSSLACRAFSIALNLESVEQITANKTHKIIPCKLESPHTYFIDIHNHPAESAVFVSQ